VTRNANRHAGNAAARRELQSGRIDPAENSHVSVASQARRIVGRDRLTWRAAASSLTLHYGQCRQAIARIVPDATWPGMFRIQYHDGHFSDVANLSRIKTAALAAALRIINSEAQETAAAGPPVRQIEPAATAAPPRTCASKGAR
jgi:hypothetical protein